MEVGDTMTRDGWDQFTYILAVIAGGCLAFVIYRVGSWIMN